MPSRVQQRLDTSAGSQTIAHITLCGEFPHHPPKEVTLSPCRYIDDAVTVESYP